LDQNYPVYSEVWSVFWATIEAKQKRSNFESDKTDNAKHRLAFGRRNDDETSRHATEKEEAEKAIGRVRRHLDIFA